MTRLIGGPFTPEEVEERLGQEIASLSAYNVQYWPLFLLGSHKHIGCGGLRLYKPQDHVYEMGIHLRPEYWGRRLAEEAGRAIITFAFDTLGAKGLFAGHHPANAASRRLLEKLGFHFTHTELYPPTGAEHPSYLLTPRDASH